jgi:PKD repeat protein
LVLANAGGSSTATATVTVADPGPVVWLSEDIAVPAAGVTPVTFDGSESASGAWTIDFGDGSPVVSGNGVPPSNLPHLFPTRGVFPVKLTVTNASGTAHAIANITPVTAYPVTSLTNAATAIGPHVATLNGANSGDTWFYFEYGPTTAYGTQTRTFTARLANTTRLVSAATPGSVLAASTAYHYRLVSGSNAGVAYGADRTFTTTAR